MENKPDPKNVKEQLEQRLFDGLKKGVLPPSPIAYQKQEATPAVPPKNVDMRPTENIETNELAKALSELKQKQSTKPFDPRATEKYAIPSSPKTPSPFPASLTDARPTMDITMDQLKKAMQETLSEGQLTNILQKYQSGSASPFLRPSPPTASPQPIPPSSLENRLSQAKQPQDDYRPTEAISLEELQRVLQENLSEQELHKIAEVGKRQHSNPTERITKQELFGDGNSPPPPPPIPPSPIAPTTQKIVQPFSASSPANPVYSSSSQPPSGIFPPKANPFSATPVSPNFPTNPPSSFIPPVAPGKQTAYSTSPLPSYTASPTPTGKQTTFSTSSLPPYATPPVSPGKQTVYPTSSLPPYVSPSVPTGKQTAYSTPQIPGKSTFSPLPIPALPSESDYTVVTPEEVPANYRIYEYFLAKKPLGSGATALVFEIFSDGARTNPIGIIKLARKGLVKLLMKEIEFAKQAIEKELSHENMIQYLKTGLNPAGLPFLVSEKLVTFPHKEFGFEDALAVVCKIAELVSYLHRNHLYHRDIKPENILFRYDGKRIVPKLFDFGTVSKQINEHSMTACSPYYASPEVLRKIRGHHSEEILFSRADVFSLGMTLLGLLKVNPYLELEYDLEKKYTDSRLLVDRLIEIQSTRQTEWLEAIENFVQEKSYAAALTIRSGVKYSPHKDLVEAIYPLIQSMLHPNPEERPIITNIAKKIDSIFQETIGVSTEQYLANNCSLNASPKTE